MPKYDIHLRPPHSALRPHTNHHTWDVSMPSAPWPMPCLDNPRHKLVIQPFSGVHVTLSNYTPGTQWVFSTLHLRQPGHHLPMAGKHHRKHKRHQGSPLSKLWAARDMMISGAGSSRDLVLSLAINVRRAWRRRGLVRNNIACVSCWLWNWRSKSRPADRRDFASAWWLELR
jgi:hypothetical protein